MDKDDVIVIVAALGGAVVRVRQELRQTSPAQVRVQLAKIANHANDLHALLIVEARIPEDTIKAMEQCCAALDEGVVVAAKSELDAGDVEDLHKALGLLAEGIAAIVEMLGGGAGAPPPAAARAPEERR